MTNGEENQKPPASRDRRRQRPRSAAYLFRARALEIDPDAIFITGGATGALHLTATVFHQRGLAAAVEDPCHRGMARCLRQVSGEMIPVEADVSGLRVENLPASGIGWIVVAPSHHFPLGGILPADRRTELVRWARTTGAWIVEDDYDAEFRYRGQPVAPLRALDAERTLYIGTFSKTLFPALRIGYLVVPDSLHREFAIARTHIDVQPPSFDQAALADFLSGRLVDRHIARVRKTYARRRQALLGALNDAFGGVTSLDAGAGGIAVLGDASGLHAAVRFIGLDFDDRLSSRARAAGIELHRVESHALTKGRWSDTLVFGYGHLDEAAIRAGVGRIAEFLGAWRAEEKIRLGGLADSMAR